jgi:hypothetical protein
MPMMRRKRLRSSFWRAVSDLGAKQEFGMPKDPFIANAAMTTCHRDCHRTGEYRTIPDRKNSGGVGLKTQQNHVKRYQTGPSYTGEWGFQDRCLKPLLSPAKKSPRQVASELKRNQFNRLVKDDFGTSTSDSAKQTENDQYC